MTQLKPFAETMTEIGNAFGFSDIPLEALETFYKTELTPSNQRTQATIINHVSSISFLRGHSDETAILLECAKLYIQLIPFIENNKNFGFLVSSGDSSRVYSNLDKLVEYFVKYHNIVTDTEVFLTRFNSIEPIELI